MSVSEIWWALLSFYVVINLDLSELSTNNLDKDVHIPKGTWGIIGEELFIPLLSHWFPTMATAKLSRDCSGASQYIKT